MNFDNALLGPAASADAGPPELPSLAAPAKAAGNVDAIRDLLRKLEEAAEESAQSAGQILLTPEAAVGAAATSPSRDGGLASLRRTGTSVAGVGAVSSGIDLKALRPLEIDVGVPPAANAGGRRRGAAIAIGAASFVLGVAAAAGVIITVDPFKALKPAATVAKAPPAQPGTKTSVPVVAQAEQARAETKVAVASQPPPAAVAAPAVSAPSSAAAAPAATEPKVQATAPVAPKAAALPQAPAAPAAAVASTPPAVKKVEPAPSIAPVSVARKDVPKAATFAVAASDRIEMRAGEVRSLGLRIEPAPRESDPVLVVLRGVPSWLTISKGSTIGDEIWLLPGHQASDLSLLAVEGADGLADIKVQIAHLDGRILAETKTQVKATRPLRPSPLVAAVPEAGEQSLLRMLARGELLLDTGEVEAARLLLRTAAEGGSVAAALKLAQTYDPGEMRRLGMAETSADPAQAVRWYERAQSLGSPLAAARLTELSAR